MEMLPSLAVAHYQAGNLDQADSLAAQALCTHPMNAEMLHLRGMVAYMKGQLDLAARFLRDAFAADPSNTAYLNNLGIVFQVQGKLAEAVSIFRQAIELNPHHLEAWSNLGSALNLQHAFVEAEARCREALAIRPGFPDALNNLGNSLVNQDRVDEAEACFREAIRNAPGFVEAHRNLGHILQAKGRFAEARAQYETVLHIKPDDALTQCSMAMCQRYTTRDHRELARIEAQLDEPRLPVLDRSLLNFAAGKFCDDVGLYDKAFRHYQRANDLVKPAWDRSAYAAWVGQVMTAFPAYQFPNPTQAPRAEPRPVFIVGMPRSGTSLVEQILSSHPAVHGAGELPDIEDLVRWLPAQPGVEMPYPTCLARLPAQLYSQMASWYLARRKATCGQASHVTDKMPTNFAHLGLIARMMPQALIIHCRRDPLDVGLSCFFQNFANRPQYAYDLGDIGFFYRQYERLMNHWRTVLPMPILDVSYEELVQDPDGQTRRLVEFVGLDWNERCVRFHENGRPVRTCSSWQVRRPVYSSSVGRWKNYAGHLEPLRRALADQAPQPATPAPMPSFITFPNGAARMS